MDLDVTAKLVLFHLQQEIDAKNDSITTALSQMKYIAEKVKTMDADIAQLRVSKAFPISSVTCIHFLIKYH